MPTASPEHMTVYLVTGGTGSHEPDSVYSVWDSAEAAQAERDRLQHAERYSETYQVRVVPLNAPAKMDKWVGSPEPVNY